VSLHSTETAPEPAVTPFETLLKGAIALLVLSSIVAVGIVLTRPPYSETRSLKEQLSSLPGVISVTLQNPKPGSLEREGLTVHVELADFGELTFLNVKPKDMASADLIRIAVQGQHRLGPYHIQNYEDALSLGRKGAYSRLFATEFRNLPDVIQKREVIWKTLAAWPRCPSEGRFDDQDGFVHYYCVDRP
jgi:hypothetical protein